MAVKLTVFARTQFEAIHNWPGCPFEDVAFLRDLHRHIFHVEIHVPVYHDDRDVEFIKLKRDVDSFINTTYPIDPAKNYRDIGHTSCEMIARTLLEQWPNATLIEVSEDGENGCRLTQD